MNYSKALRVLRAAKGIDQQELARRTGLSKSLLSKIEGGSRALSIENRKKIARAIDIPISLFDILAIEPKNSKVTINEAENLGMALLKIKDEIGTLR